MGSKSYIIVYLKVAEYNFHTEKYATLPQTLSFFLKQTCSMWDHIASFAESTIL